MTSTSKHVCQIRMADERLHSYYKPWYIEWKRTHDTNPTTETLHAWVAEAKRLQREEN